MAYNEALAGKARSLLQGEAGFAEKKMFGGLCFLLHGNMACGILNDDLIVRVGLPQYETALRQPRAGKFDFTGRPMKGWVMVSGAGLDTEESLADWLARGVAFARTLPPK